MKRLISLILSVIMLVGCFGLDALAQETVYPKVYHTYTSTEDSASDAWQTASRGTYLGSGMSTITREDRTHINIGGDTTATRTCDKIQLVLFVERSTSYATGYGNYRTYIYEAEDVYQLVKGISDIYVERGYYYRVKGVHTVTHNGVMETTNTVTNPIDYR